MVLAKRAPAFNQRNNTRSAEEITYSMFVVFRRQSAQKRVFSHKIVAHSATGRTKSWHIMVLNYRWGMQCRAANTTRLSLEICCVAGFKLRWKQDTWHEWTTSKELDGNPNLDSMKHSDASRTNFQRQCMRLELEPHVARNRIFNIFNTICIGIKKQNRNPI